ncbi:SRPBCC family protein [Prochlorococcus sp. MIT 1300]|uniref:SRPBCC family protein n=1 Tax=Prochlorococcus sp. MIT 1300 TaxID=3096218 RepID=UPI002A751125|nr:SRPBCC family protein [Prochlorococcus sp. MIT 1300]
MGRWLEHTVVSNIDAPVDQVWKVWSDLEAMPLWMSWIESVKTMNEEDKVLPDLTEWTLAANGFRFKWKAKITERVDAQKLQWESIGGLPTKGAVRFYEEKDNSTVVKLCVSYELPRVLAPIMEPNILGGMVTNELQENINRFKKLVESGYSKNN